MGHFLKLENMQVAINVGVQTCSILRQMMDMAFISQKESRKVDEALKDEHLIMTMQEELNQFERSNV